MRRVVVTGMGIWSCIGQDLQTVTESLRQGRSGIIFDPRRIEYGLRSGLVGNVPRPNLKPLLPRKFRATMSEDAEYAYMAARQAFEQAGLSDEYLRQNEVGIIFGNDVNNSSVVEHFEEMKMSHSTANLLPWSLLKEETSSVTMNIATIFHLKGINLTIGNTCTSGLTAIGIGALLIREGLQDIILVGGVSNMTLDAAAVYDSTGGFSLNTNPNSASRPFDTKSDGTIFSDGGAALVIEEYDHALTRGANIIAEIVGYGSTNGGETDISHLVSEGIVKSIHKALNDAGASAEEIDYVNAGALSARYEDAQEAVALSHFFANSHTCISSTESTTGHETFMAGASKTIYTILMMKNNFVAPNMNLEQVIDEAKNLNIVTKSESKEVNIALINSLGGGNAFSSLIIKKI